MIKIGIIGYGYWGPNLVRNFNANKSFQIVKVADSRQERLHQLRKAYNRIECTTSIDDITNDNMIDAVAIATPVFTHYEFAKKALENGKHVLLEKPMTSNSFEAVSLIELALKKNKTLMVDHTFLYTGAVQKIKSLIDEKAIGKVEYIDSTRINLGLFQPDINVLWDLAPHDISIVNFLMTEKPHSVNTTGISHTKNGIENIGYITLNYPSDLIAHFNCSWTSPVKIRKFLVGGDEKMIVWDDMEPTEKVKIYDTGYKYNTDEDKHNLLVDYRTGDIYTPKVTVKEALAGVVDDFLDAIMKGSTPLGSAVSGANVVKVLEASQESIKNKGKEVNIQYL